MSKEMMSSEEMMGAKEIKQNKPNLVLPVVVLVQAKRGVAILEGHDHVVRDQGSCITPKRDIHRSEHKHSIGPPRSY
jgi:hypothetical protein